MTPEKQTHLSGLAREANIRFRQFEDSSQSAMEHAVAVGERMATAKAIVDRTDGMSWDGWVRGNCEFSCRHSYRFLEIFENRQYLGKGAVNRDTRVTASMRSALQSIKEARQAETQEPDQPKPPPKTIYKGPELEPTAYGDDGERVQVAVDLPEAGDVEEEELREAILETVDGALTVDQLMETMTRHAKLLAFRMAGDAISQWAGMAYDGTQSNDLRYALLATIRRDSRPLEAIAAELGVSRQAVHKGVRKWQGIFPEQWCEQYGLDHPQKWERGGRMTAP